MMMMMMMMMIKKSKFNPKVAYGFSHYFRTLNYLGTEKRKAPTTFVTMVCDVEYVHVFTF